MLRKFFILILAMAGVMLDLSAACAQPEEPTIVYVDAESTNVAPPSDANPGSSWTGAGTSAYKYLQNGLTRADQLLDFDPFTPIQIWVANGMYRADQGELPSLPDARMHTLRLRENVRICGGFLGTEPETNTGFQSRNPITNVTVITGDLGANDDLGIPATWTDNTFHILRADSVNSSAIIDGFTIASGNANNSELPIEERVGGGMVILGGTDFEPQLPVNACLPTILRCRFEVNRARNGGAVFLAIHQQSVPRFQNCVFLGNRADGDGGAVYSYGAPASIGGKPRFDNSLFVSNRALGNLLEPVGKGGAMFVHEAAGGRMHNCTLTLNEGAGGAGGVHQTGTCDIGTPGRGGGVHIANCIIWDNTGAALIGENTTSYSHVQNGICAATGGTNNSNANPFLIGGGNWRLQATSPCIDSGDNGQAATDAFDINQNNDVGDKAPDLDGRERLAGAEPPSGSDCGTVDRGAYEFAAPYCAADIASATGAGGDGLVNIDDLLAVVGAWGACPDPDNCLADIIPLALCGNDEVDIDDLLFVISNWGTCPGIVPPPGGVGDIPDEFYDCWDACSGKPYFGACMQDCFKALCELGHTEYCE